MTTSINQLLSSNLRKLSCALQEVQCFRCAQHSPTLAMHGLHKHSTSTDLSHSRKVKSQGISCLLRSLRTQYRLLKSPPLVSIVRHTNSGHVFATYFEVLSCAMKQCGGAAASILKLGTGRRWVISLSGSLPYPSEKAPPYSLYMRVGGHKNRFEPCAKEKNLCSYREFILDF
jgi:hypothetical protein